MESFHTHIAKMIHLEEPSLLEKLIFPVSVAVAGGVLVYIIYTILQVGRRPKNYPPGPPTLPILGNLHQVTISPSINKELLLISIPRCPGINLTFNGRNGLRSMGEHIVSRCGRAELTRRDLSTPSFSEPRRSSFSHHRRRLRISLTDEAPYTRPDRTCILHKT